MQYLNAANCSSMTHIAPSSNLPAALITKEEELLQWQKITHGLSPPIAELSGGMQGLYGMGLRNVKAPLAICLLHLMGLFC